MAEFKEVMNEAKRMCGNGCHGCAFDGSRCLCEFLGDCIFRGSITPEEFEDAVMKWAKEHPRKKYPSWREWGTSILMEGRTSPLLPCIFIECKKSDYCCATPCPRLDEEVPEEFAVKARILPVDEKGRFLD